LPNGVHHGSTPRTDWPLSRSPEVGQDMRLHTLRNQVPPQAAEGVIHGALNLTPARMRVLPVEQGNLLQRVPGFCHYGFGGLVVSHRGLLW
jgi:hypothetical protein